MGRPRGFNGTPGPWFPAAYPGDCSRCSGPFDDGEQIRADGSGGYECCADDDIAPDTAPTARPDRFVGGNDEEMGFV